MRKISEKGNGGGQASGTPCAWRGFPLDLDHVEVALGRAAFRTNPVVRNLGPSCARRQPFIGVAFCLVIDVAAGPALPGFVRLDAHRDFPSCMGRFCLTGSRRVLALRKVILFVGAARQGDGALSPLLLGYRAEAAPASPPLGRAVANAKAGRRRKKRYIYQL